MDFLKYPYPDKNYPHPMQTWPEEVTAPFSIKLTVVDAAEDEVPPIALNPNPQNGKIISQRTCLITMTGGATLSVVDNGDAEGGNFEDDWTGDWNGILKDDTYSRTDLRDQILAMAMETLLQARK